MVKSCTVEPEVFGMTEDKLDSLERALTRINETVMAGSIFRNCITQVSPAPAPARPSCLRPPAASEYARRARASQRVRVRPVGRPLGMWHVGRGCAW